MTSMLRRVAVSLTVALGLMAGTAVAQEPADFPYDGMIRIDTEYDFPTLWSRLEGAVRDHEMLLLLQASASRGAATRDIDIPGNGVMDIYRNDFAVRMLNASVAAGWEAPMRFYMVEAETGTAALIYRLPSARFAPYGSAELDALGAELDELFASIAAQTTEAQ